MKLSISNIAWDFAEEIQALKIMQSFGVKGVEIAPTKVWNSPALTESNDIQAYRLFWNEHGIEISALQSLLFGKPELVIFGEPQVRELTLSYLAEFIRIAATLGARVLVFGSPKNRQIGSQPVNQVWNTALDFFWRVGEIAQQNGVCFCIEPNAAEYGCDFIRTANEAVELIRRVNHPGFRLHLDAGVMTLNGEDYGRELEAHFEWIEHFHISEPFLGLIGVGKTNHKPIAVCLRRLGYDRWISIEMRTGLMSPNLAAVSRALDFASQIYA